MYTGKITTTKFNLKNNENEYNKQETPTKIVTMKKENATRQVFLFFVHHMFLRKIIRAQK